MRDLARDKVVELIQNKYGVLMHKIAYEILKDWHYVEDVEQEVLWKLILHCEDKTMLPPDELKSYLCTAVKNTAINMAVKNGRMTEAEERYYGSISLTMEFVDTVAFHDKYGFGPQIQELLSNLDNIDRDIICLQYGQGYSRKETAEILGKSEEFVKKRSYRARTKLKSILAHAEGEQEMHESAIEQKIEELLMALDKEMSSSRKVYADAIQSEDIPEPKFVIGTVQHTSKKILNDKSQNKFYIVYKYNDDKLIRFYDGQNNVIMWQVGDNILPQRELG